jgi:hypothetical protein
MSLGLNQRRRTEINAKVKSLQAELDHWEGLTKQENRGLRRHYSQIRRIAAVLQGLTESVNSAIGSLSAEPTAVLDQAISLESEILAAHAIWEVFRSKFVLREDEMFRDILAACDDLAWECYGPAMRRFAPDRKGPPLVYFSATWSPFMMPRDSSFHNEVRAGPGAAGVLRDEAFLQVQKRLPIPLIGIPWYHAYHLPGALIIAHEVGHVVEFDFDLSADIDAALSNAQLDHEAIWKKWASEVFADLYGCLCLGPAFVGAMMDLLSTSVSAVQTETRTDGKYPTRTLRMELMIEALARTGHMADAARLRATWENAYGPMKTMLAFTDDVCRVIKALCSGPYRGGPLTNIIGFPTNVTAELATIGEAAANGMANFLEQKNITDPRRLFAGAQWLHENPQPRQDSKAAYALIVAQVVKKAANQFRSRGVPVADKAVVDAELKAQQQTDRDSGRELASLLAAAVE